jgi:glycosyltransferase involved in cell wall biosynthesis
VVIMVAYVYAPKSLVHRGTGIKGHNILLEAWRTFHQDCPAARLILVGGGWDAAGEAHRQDLIARYAVTADPSVEWATGVIDVGRYYAAADVSVSPSLSENHGAALEAGACGVPSIVSDAGGLPETVSASSGWVVPAGDDAAVLAALGTAESAYRAGELGRRGQSARALVERRFDSSDCARAVADVLEVAGGIHPVSRRRRRVASTAAR